MGLPRGAGMINLPIKDKVALYASYMPFVKGGALFVIVTLPDDAERMPLTGKVVWVNHRNQGQRPAGFGVQLGGGEGGDALRRKIEGQLGGALTADRPTYTL